jgi:hypothetical protein
MQSHPTSETDAYTAAEEGTEEQPSSPFKAFFDALEELEDNKALYGKASLEAEIARGHLDRMRVLAVEAWRSREAA